MPSSRASPTLRPQWNPVPGWELTWVGASCHPDHTTFGYPASRASTPKTTQLIANEEMLMHLSP
eukprot:276443-Pleurochrysis_carterae.AAC.1